MSESEWSTTCTETQKRPRLGFIDGRFEKRFDIAVSVFLAGLKESRTRERTVTENVSPHGARVDTARFWRRGEKLMIMPLIGEFLQDAQVIYCHRKANDRFCIGVKFSARPVRWERER